MSENKLVLVVDDDPDVVEAVSMKLESKKYRVAKAYDGVEAWDRVKEERPDLIVSTSNKKVRIGKIYLDYLRNKKGATCVAPYSVRATEQATISMPLAWRDLKKLSGANRDTVQNVNLKKISRKSPWKALK